MAKKQNRNAKMQKICKKRQAPLPVARDRKGRELVESRQAQRRLVRKAQAQQKEAAQLAAELARC